MRVEKRELRWKETDSQAIRQKTRHKLNSHVNMTLKKGLQTGHLRNAEGRKLL